MDFITNVLSADKAPSASVLSLPATLLLAAVPHWYTIYHAESKKVQGGWANENPRAFVARLNAKAAQGKKLSDLEEMILRGQSAQQNAFEWWAVWAVAVVIGHFTKVPNETLRNMTVLHIATRIVYTYLYVAMSTRKSSYLRTLVFQLSIFPAIRIFFKAASTLAG